jgi:general secretion pathway protein A
VSEPEPEPVQAPDAPPTTEYEWVPASPPRQGSTAPAAPSQASPPGDGAPESASGESSPEVAPSAAPAPAPLGSPAPALAAAAAPAPTALAAAPPPEPPPAAPPTASLEDAIAGSSPAAATAEALRAVLDVWGAALDVPPYLASLDDALARLAAAEFSVLALRNANLATLELFNHAALLRLRAIDGTPRTVLLIGLEGDQATVVGLRGSEPLRVPWAELEPRWTHETWIAWRDFAHLPPVLAAGQRGDGVAWLQATLESLGFLSAANRSGVFDEATRDAVREFQRSRSLVDDGTVGPLTKVILYQALPQLAIPRLVPVRRDEGLG